MNHPRSAFGAPPPGGRARTKNSPCGLFFACEGQPTCLAAGDASDRAKPGRGVCWMLAAGASRIARRVSEGSTETARKRLRRSPRFATGDRAKPGRGVCWMLDASASRVARSVPAYGAEPAPKRLRRSPGSRGLPFVRPRGH